MHCHEVRHLLLRRPDNTIDADVASPLTAHLQACENCSRYARQLDRLPRILGHGPAIELPPDLARSVLARLSANRAAAPIRPAATIPTATATALLVACGALATIAFQNLATADSWPLLVGPALALATDVALRVAELVNTTLHLAQLAGDMAPVAAHSGIIAITANVATLAAAAVAAMAYATRRSNAP